MADLSPKQRCIGNWINEQVAGLIAGGADPNLISERDLQAIRLLAHAVYGLALDVKAVDVEPVKPAESFDTAA